MNIQKDESNMNFFVISKFFLRDHPLITRVVRGQRKLKNLNLIAFHSQKRKSVTFFVVILAYKKSRFLLFQLLRIAFVFSSAREIYIMKLTIIQNYRLPSAYSVRQFFVQAAENLGTRAESSYFPHQWGEIYNFLRNVLF